MDLATHCTYHASAIRTRPSNASYNSSRSKYFIYNVHNLVECIQASEVAENTVPVIDCDELEEDEAVIDDD